MKLLHTSDLHLGLRLCERPMNDDIEHLLCEIIYIAKTEKCDGVIVAGDIYDRSNPGADSVAIFDKFVTELADLGIAVFAVSGNHDSPERVAYMASLLGKMGVHFSPVYDGNIEPATFEDEFGRVNIWLLPFLRPSTVCALYPEFCGETYTDAVKFVISRMNIDQSERNVLVTHQFVADPRATREDNVGGIMAVDYRVFAPFDYTAVGHLHSPHHVGNDTVRYSGSPLKCSFSEVNDTKSVEILEIGEKGKVTLHRVPLHQIHEMREIKGEYDYVMSLECRNSGDSLDYVRIILTDNEDIPDVVQKLRVAYPNMLRLTYDNARTREYKSVDSLSRYEMEALTPEDVFSELYEIQNNAPAGEAEMNIVKRIMKEIMGEVGR
ncbi:MAG: exonuclease SbcCD subunit D [Ruminococcaceae bacterium]|nr:exonuclease SbcCD subunit D [Oscillospiraceae bacterium]